VYPNFGRDLPRREQGNGPFDAAREFGQYTCLEPSIPDCWLEGRLVVHLHMRVRASGCEREPCDVCVSFNPSPAGEAVAPHGSGVLVGSEPNVSGRLKAHIDHVAERWMDEAVLVHLVEPVQDAEKVVVRASPALVRLMLLDDCTVLRSNALEQGVFSFSEPLARPTNWVFGGGAVAGRVGQTRELADEMIERGAQVVGEVSEEQAKKWRRLVDDFDCEDILTTARPELAVDFVGWSLGQPARIEGDGLLVEGVEMFVGPFELCDRGGEVGDGGHAAPETVPTDRASTVDKCARTVRSA
jgi:hypothetical protein